MCCRVAQRTTWTLMCSIRLFWSQRKFNSRWPCTSIACLYAQLGECVKNIGQSMGMLLWSHMSSYASSGCSSGSDSLCLAPSQWSFKLCWWRRWCFHIDQGGWDHITPTSLNSGDWLMQSRPPIGSWQRWSIKKMPYASGRMLRLLGKTFWNFYETFRISKNFYALSMSIILNKRKMIKSYLLKPFDSVSN